MYFNKCINVLHLNFKNSKENSNRSVNNFENIILIFYIHMYKVSHDFII